MVRAGAVEVMLRDRLVGESLERRVLTSGVDQLVAALNGLATREQFLAALDLQEKAGLLDGAIPCQMGRTGRWTWLVLRYPDGRITTVHVDHMCRASTTEDGAVRFGDVLDDFDRLYQAQPTPEPPDTGALHY